jgi:Ca2+-binding EF-hand superfamily protein
MSLSIHIDKDHDGAITASELGAVMRSIGKSPTDVELVSIIKGADVNGDGRPISVLLIS